jgi:hypothetical protein
MTGASADGNTWTLVMRASWWRRYPASVQRLEMRRSDLEIRIAAWLAIQRSPASFRIEPSAFHSRQSRSWSHLPAV